MKGKILKHEKIKIFLRLQLFFKVEDGFAGKENTSTALAVGWHITTLGILTQIVIQQSNRECLIVIQI